MPDISIAANNSSRTMSEKFDSSSRLNHNDNNSHRDSNTSETHTWTADSKDLKDMQETEESNLDRWLVIIGTFMIILVGLGVPSGWYVQLRNNEVVWLTTTKCLFSYFCAFYTHEMESIGDYYEQHMNAQGAASDITLQLTFVITICNILINLLAPLGQILSNKFGTRIALFIAVLCCSTGLILAGFSNKVWHLYITQGFIYGIGCSIMFYIALTVVPKWFLEQKGLALGILSSGISIGGLAMPLIMEPLNSRLGAAWCFRILGFICFGSGMISCLLLKEKKTATMKDDEKIQDIVDDNEKFSFRKTFNFGSVLKNPRFLLWVLSEIFMETAFNVPIVFIPSYATYIGLSTTQGAVLLSVCSGTNAVGRLFAGFAADFIGHVNVILLYTILTGLSSLLIWMYATSFSTLMAFAVIFGFFGGAFITLTPTITSLVTGSEGFESGVSAFLILSTIAQCGPNLASAVELTVHAAKPFDSYKYFTGVSYLLGAFLLTIFKLSLNRNPFAKI